MGYLCQWDTFANGMPLPMRYLCQWDTFANEIPLPMGYLYLIRLFVCLEKTTPTVTGLLRDVVIFVYDIILQSVVILHMSITMAPVTFISRRLCISSVISLRLRSSMALTLKWCLSALKPRLGTSFSVDSVYSKF